MLFCFLRNSLKELRFKGCYRITASSAAPIGECSELEVLHPHHAVTSKLSEIVEGLPKLRDCEFSSSSLSAEGVIGLAMSCPELEILDLSFCLSIFDAAVASLVQCRALKELELSGNAQLTDAAFASLSEGCWPKMEILHLYGIRRLSDASISSLARACPSLVGVWLGSTNVTDEAVWTLCQLCPSILELYINDCPNVINRSLVAISEHLPSLTFLECERNEAITDDGIEKLVAKCHSIKELRICGCRLITDRSVLQIADQCPNLEELDVHGNDHITAVSLEALGAKCLKLETVYMRGLWLVSRENKDNLRLHFPHIDWRTDDDEDEDSDEEEEDQDQDQDQDQEEEKEEEEEEEEEF